MLFWEHFSQNIRYFFTEIIEKFVMDLLLFQKKKKIIFTIYI